MSERTELLFSVDRLRKAWAGRKPQEGGTPETDPPSTGDPAQPAVAGAVETLREVARLVRVRFPDAKGRAFEPLLGALEEKVMLRFAGAPGRSEPVEEHEALNCAIDELLSRIERLAEAMDRAGWRKNSDVV